MPLRLCGAPAVRQRWINDLLREYLDKFCTAYLDDVLIWSNRTKEEHFKKVGLVLERLTNADLKLDLKKCDIAVKQVKYLRFIVTAEKRIEVDPDKIIRKEKWEIPRS